MSDSSQAIVLVEVAPICPPFSTRSLIPNGSWYQKESPQPYTSEPKENRIETGLTCRFQSNAKEFRHIGGIRLDWLNASWPFATLSANEEELRILCLDHNYIFKRHTIKSLTRHHGKLSVGLRIEHESARAPKLVVFWASLTPWSSGFYRLKRHLDSLGYQVQD